MSDLKLSAARLENCGKEAEKRVLDAVTSSQLSGACYAIKTRVKKESKLVEKVQLKIIKKPSYAITSVTDVVGLRLITLFKSEMIGCVERVLDLISHGATISPNPFIKDSLEEFKIYSDSPIHDPLLIKLQDLLSKRGIEFQKEESNNRYSSVHLVCRLSQKAEVVIDGEDCSHNVPIEIQVRTVFEDAWGEVDHRFGYVFRQGKHSPLALANHTQIGPHLKVLKQFADACSEYADTIYGMANANGPQTDTVGKILSVGSDDGILARFHALNVPQDLVGSYVEGRAMRDRAAETFKENPQLAVEKYLEAAEHFSATVDAVGSSTLPNEPARFLFYYYIAMNHALCLLSAGTELHVSKALQIYSDLSKSYPAYPLIKFRMAQAYGNSGAADSAIHLYNEARTQIDLIRRENSGNWTDNLPESDFHHMVGLLPKLLGYQYWKLGELLQTSKDVSEIQERALCYQRAYEETVKGKELRPNDVYMDNNIAYYACEYISLIRASGNSRSDNNPLLTEMLRTIERTSITLEASSEALLERPDLFLLDTLLRCHQALGHESNARRVAKRIAAQRTRLVDLDPQVAIAIQNRALEAMSM